MALQQTLIRSFTSPSGTVRNAQLSPDGTKLLQMVSTNATEVRYDVFNFATGALLSSIVPSNGGTWGQPYGFIDNDGNIYYNKLSGGLGLYKVTPGGTVSLFISCATGRANRIDPETNEVILLEYTTNGLTPLGVTYFRISRWNLAGTMTHSYVASPAELTQLGWPYTEVECTNGNIWFRAADQNPSNTGNRARLWMYDGATLAPVPGIDYASNRLVGGDIIPVEDGSVYIECVAQTGAFITERFKVTPEFELISQPPDPFPGTTRSHSSDWSINIVSAMGSNISYAYGSVDIDAPTANAGPDQEVQYSDLATLDGSGTTWPSSVGTYAWTQLSGPAVTLSSTSVASPSFTSSVPGTFVFRLTVTDSLAQTDTDEVTIVIPTPVGYVNIYKLNQLDLFAGSESEYGDVDGPVLESRFMGITDIASVWNSTQRSNYTAGNRFYAVDNSTIKMIHECGLTFPEPELYWLGYSDGTQVYTSGTPDLGGKFIYFTESIVNTTSDLYEFHRDYPEFLNHGTFVASNGSDDFTYEIELHLELTVTGTTYWIWSVHDSYDNYSPIIEPSPFNGSIVIDWSDTWTTPAGNLILAASIENLSGGTVAIGAGSYMKITEA